MRTILLIHHYLSSIQYMRTERSENLTTYTQRTTIKSVSNSSWMLSWFYSSWATNTFALLFFTELLENIHRSPYSLFYIDTGGLLDFFAPKSPEYWRYYFIPRLEKYSLKILIQSIVLKHYCHQRQCDLYDSMMEDLQNRVTYNPMEAFSSFAESKVHQWSLAETFIILLAIPPLLRTAGANFAALGNVESPHEDKSLLTISCWLKLKKKCLAHSLVEGHWHPGNPNDIS